VTAPLRPPRLITPRFLIVTASTFAYFMAVGMMVPSLPRYVKGPLGGGAVAIGLTVGAFSLASIMARPAIGFVGDRRGRRVLMVIGPLLVAVAVAMYPLAHGVGLLLLLRIVQGAGEGSFFVGAASAITDLAPDDRRGEAVSYFSVALYLGLALGPSLAEAVLHGSHFGRVWTMVSIFAVVASLLSLGVGETRPEEHRQLEPPRTRLFHPAALRPGAVLGLGMIGFAGFSAFVPLYAINTLHLSGSGPVYLVYAGITIAIRIFGARIPDQLGARRTAIIANAWVAAGLFVMGAWPSAVGLYVGTSVFAIGIGLNYPALMSLAVAAAPATERAAVVGTYSAFFDVGQGIGAVILGGVAAVAGYRGAFIGGGCSAAIGFILILTRRRATLAGGECQHGPSSRPRPPLSASVGHERNLPRMATARGQRPFLPNPSAQRSAD
jgi:MFS family permease